MQGGPIIEHLARVGFLGCAFVEQMALSLELKHFTQGDLRPLDLAGQNGFPRCQGRQQNIGIGNACQHPFIAGDSRIGRSYQSEE
jgi:hypothetical protein